ncbi:ead/Ea22-like family protein [Klebsiella pneumoniae]|uniref:ead/Ea22-like family protein n=2 Tax=Klebsiella pneumoniae TaxID=573 RepID=UPI002DB5A08A|nr:ead/Ea22-like family protein [Klebsiella pneumoniae]MEB5803591.1 ead/Ea22-like family protein [Klebsiella pneumoniae]
MTDITKLAQSLKAAADNAGADYWQAKKISGDFYVIRKGSYKRECGYTTYQPIAEIDHKPTRDYVAMANPTNILALVEALEKAQQRIAELDIKNCELDSLTQRWAVERAENADRIAELESRTVTVENLQESAYRAGLTAGWNLGLANNNDGFNKCLAAHAAGIKVEAER